MLHPDFTNILMLLDKLDIHALINTNASLLHNRDDYIFLENCSFQVTLDSLIEKEQDSIRGSHSFSNIANLRSIIPKKSNTNASLRINLTKKNCDYIDEFIDKAIEWGYDEASFGFLVPYGRAKNFDGIINRHDDPDLWSSIVNRLELQKKQLGSAINLELVNCYPRTDCPFIYPDKLKISPRVASNGDIYPCLLCDDDKFIIGNIHDKPITDILLDESFQALSRVFIARAWEDGYIQECKVCAWKKICFKGCPAVAFETYKSFNNHDGNCDFLKRLYLKKAVRSS